MKQLAQLILLLVTLMANAQAQDAELIRQGQYLARAGDCISCHTVGANAPFSGGRALRTPFGVLYSPNITADSVTGIGNWSFDQFYQALHQGLSKDGTPLYPVFSYTSYTKVKRDDVKAIYAYLQSLPAVQAPNRQPEFGFPYNLRVMLYSWRALYFQAGEYQDDASQSAQWNRGAYLVQGLGHCNECHSTRNALGAMDQRNPLSGGHIPVEGWYAPDLSLQAGGGLAGWSQADVVALLKTGLSDKGSALGPMAEVVRNSTSYLNDEDLQAIALYLASLPAVAPAPLTLSKAANYDAGKAIFANLCASCHGLDGQGKTGVYPSLVGNISVLNGGGVNAIRSVLLGGFSPTTASNPEPYSMPPFAKRLSDDKVASVINYLRQSWGNQATPISSEDVRLARFQSKL